MTGKTEYPQSLTQAAVVIGGALVALLTALAPGASIAPVGVGDTFLLSWLALHLLWGLSLVLRDPRQPVPWADLAPAAEGLFFYGLFLLLFAYIFALNANMDYVQRFIESGGNLQIALDTRTERRIAMARYLPLLLVDLGVWLAAGRQRQERRTLLQWSPVLTLLAVALSVLAMPNGLNLEGWGALGWVALVPLFLVMRQQTRRGNPGRAIWYGILYGVLFTLTGNFWLGTFNLVSLQAVGIIFLGFYGVLMPLLVLGLMRAPRRALALVIPLGWTAWELFRSSGFLGYPWLLVAHSQYRNIPLIQIAEWGGVWLVSLVVLVVNSAVAELILAAMDRSGGLRRRLVVILAIPAVATAVGALLLPQVAGEEEQDTVRLAMVQQNTDPRKHEYAATLEALQRLTAEALQHQPDLVVWSETAFVPNIRRWSGEDPRRYSLARLVQEFTAWQESIDTWLLTGNDDYARVFDDDGQEIDRHSFNAAVLLDDTGGRRETYHKIKLVPFTEHFPFERQLPWIYNMLLDFDVSFWTPGTERVIFDHPRFRFATPICFEDVFPEEVRQFALAGMQVIVNISNDYWSLQETAAQQHFAASLFRTVELRRPMVRSTASGVTAHVDATGRILATVPQYTEQILIADVAVPPADAPPTLYQRLGDWVPWTAGVLFLLISFVVPAGAAFAGKRPVRARRRQRRSPPGDS